MAEKPKENPHFFHPLCESGIYFFALSLRWYKVILIPMQIAIDIHIALTKKNQHNHHHHQLFQVPLVIFFLLFFVFAAFIYSQRSCSFVFRTWFETICREYRDDKAFDRKRKYLLGICRCEEYWIRKRLTSNFLDIRAFIDTCQRYAPFQIIHGCHRARQSISIYIR